MALPKVTGYTGQDHVVDFGEIQVTFQLRLISGVEYNQILDAARGEDGKAKVEDVAVPTLIAGVSGVYSSEASKLEDFTKADATEIWDDWPEWARLQLYRAVVAYSTTGPTGDPLPE